MMVTKIDRDALARSMEIAMRNRKLAAQLDDQLKDRPWLEVAEFSAYCCQVENLKLLPHQSPPCGFIGNDPDAAALLRRLLAAGLSRYEPDPIAALAKE
jgi:hypothetical protein